MPERPASTRWWNPRSDVAFSARQAWRPSNSTKPSSVPVAPAFVGDPPGELHAGDRTQLVEEVGERLRAGEPHDAGRVVLDAVDDRHRCSGSKGHGGLIDEQGQRPEPLGPGAGGATASFVDAESTMRVDEVDGGEAGREVGEGHDTSGSSPGSRAGNARAAARSPAALRPASGCFATSTALPPTSGRWEGLEASTIRRSRSMRARSQ